MRSFLAVFIAGCSGGASLDAGVYTDDAGFDAGRIRATLLYARNLGDGGACLQDPCSVVADITAERAEWLATVLAAAGCDVRGAYFDCLTGPQDFCGTNGAGCCTWAPVGARLDECVWTPP